MKNVRKLTERVQKLEEHLNVGSVSVLKIRMWRPEIDGVGTVYMKNNNGAGKRFSNDAEADRYIEAEKKRARETP